MELNISIAKIFSNKISKYVLENEYLNTGKYNWEGKTPKTLLTFF